MDNFKKIQILQNEFEAQLLHSILDEQGIPHLIKSYHDTAYDGVFQFQKGWAHVEAPEVYKSNIETIYSELTGVDGE